MLQHTEAVPYTNPMLKNVIGNGHKLGVEIKTADSAHMSLLPSVTRSFSTILTCGPVYENLPYLTKATRY